VALVAASAVLVAASPVVAAAARTGFVLCAVSVLVDQWNETGWVICRGRGRARVEAEAEVISDGALLAVAAVSLAVGRGLPFGVAGVLLLAAALARSAVAVTLLRSWPSPPWSALGAVARRHLRAAVPYCAADMLGLAYLRGDTAVLAVFASSSVVGAYVAANSLVGPVVQVAAMMGVAALAVMARRAGEEDDDGRGGQEALLVALFAAAGSVVAVGLMVALWTMTPMLFARHVGAIRSLGLILALFLPLRFANFALSSVLLAAGGAARRLGVVAATVLINVGLNVAVDGRLGAFGAAWATVLTEAAVTALFLRVVAVKPAAYVPLAGVGAAVVAASVWLAVALRGAHPLPVLVVPPGVALLAAGAGCAALAARAVPGPALDAVAWASGGR
jgi:O-antigen/teichoic acid export membrane protein